jgi:hypothetical protein
MIRYTVEGGWGGCGPSLPALVRSRGWNVAVTPEPASPAEVSFGGEIGRVVGSNRSKTKSTQSCFTKEEYLIIIDLASRFQWGDKRDPLMA